MIKTVSSVSFQLQLTVGILVNISGAFIPGTVPTDILIDSRSDEKHKMALFRASIRTNISLFI